MQIKYLCICRTLFEHICITALINRAKWICAKISELDHNPNMKEKQETPHYFYKSKRFHISSLSNNDPYPDSNIDKSLIFCVHIPLVYEHLF